MTKTAPLFRPKSQFHESDAPQSIKSADHVFLVEDDPHIRAILCQTLKDYSFRPTAFASGIELLDHLDHKKPSLILLDLGLPDVDGMALIERIRQRSNVPILVVSARAHTSDRVMGLELGADDYLCKPFDPREVIARLRSLLRRTQPPKNETITDNHHTATFAGWTFIPSSQQLSAPDGETSFLSTGEAALLNALLDSPGRVLSRDQLLDYCGGDESLDRSIDVRISRVRKKLSIKGRPPLIRTVYGSGYMFTTTVEWQ